MSRRQRYQGHLLVANPNNPKDDLEKSVIMIVTHADSLAIGIQINKPHEEITLSKVAANLGVGYMGNDPCYYGGNMAMSKIHVIHSLDWRGMTTAPLSKEIGITNDISILAAISRGDGPKYFKACSGYWLWEDGRLETQLDPRNSLPHEPHKWEIAKATIDNTFLTNDDDLWQEAIEASAKYLIDAYF